MSAQAVVVAARGNEATAVKCSGLGLGTGAGEDEGEGAAVCENAVTLRQQITSAKTSTLLLIYFPF